MYRVFGLTSLAAISGAVMLAGCATTADVEKAQATANQAVADAGAAHMAADVAGQKADRAGAIAMQAQATASSAQALAQSANSSAQQVSADLNAAQLKYQAWLFSRQQPRVAYLERPVKRHFKNRRERG